MEHKKSFFAHHFYPIQFRCWKIQLQRCPDSFPCSSVLSVQSVILFHLRYPQPVPAAFAVGLLDRFGGTEDNHTAKYYINYQIRNGLSNPCQSF